MAPTPRSDLALLLAGVRRMAQERTPVLGLGLLATILSALAPLLQSRVGPLREEVAPLLHSALLLPLEMYFIPRLLARLDAQRLDRPENPREGWRQRFDERWLRAFGAKFLLGLGGGLALVLVLLPLPGPLLALPALFGLMLFAWTPTRVLLRGERLGEAARGSLRIMGTQWPRVLLVGCSAYALYLASGLMLDKGLGLLVPRPTLFQQLTHPAFHGAHLLLGLLGVWLNLTLLELFHAVELPQEGSEV